MIKPRVRIIALLVLVLSVAGVQQPPVRAQQQTEATQSALAVSPAIIEQVLESGKPTKFSLQVNNVTNFPLPIKSLVQGFTVQSTTLEKTEAKRLNAIEWITIEEPDFILQPKQVRTVKGTIRPPADATPGGHYATIFFQPLVPIEALSPSSAQLNAKVGVLVFMIIKGDIIQKADYQKQLQTDNTINHGPAHFTFSVHNSGNVHLFPNGKLVIYDVRGQRAATLPLPIGAILPDATKEYNLQWDAPKALGNYRAELEVTYGNDNTALKKTVVTFWIIPWIEIVIGIALLTVATLFIAKTRRRWRKAWQVLRGKSMRFDEG